MMGDSLFQCHADPYSHGLGGVVHHQGTGTAPVDNHRRSVLQAHVAPHLGFGSQMRDEQTRDPHRTSFGRQIQLGIRIVVVEQMFDDK